MGRSEAWRRLSVSEIAEINPRRQVRIGETVPFVEMAAVRTDLPHVDYVGEREAKGSGSRFTNGDTLFARITPCTENGKTSFVDYLPDGSVGMGSTEFIVLGPRRDLVEPKYLYWLVRSELVRKPAIANMIGTSGRQRVPTSVFDEITVQIPPIEDQRRISKILDSVDDAIKTTRAVIEQTRKVKQGMLQALLTHGIGHARFKQTEIGEVPEGWEVERVGAVANVAYGLTVNAARRKSKHRFPYLTVANVKSGRIDLTSIKDIGLLPGDVEQYRLQHGDLLLVEGNGNPELLGMPALWEQHGRTMFHQNHLIRVRTEGDRVYPGWLYECFMAPAIRRQIRARAKTSSGLHTINSRVVREVCVPVPSKQEQGRILDVLQSATIMLMQGASELERLEQVRRGITEALLAGRVRVNFLS